MADIKNAYAASAALTITLNALASDTNLLAGRESTVVDNTSNKYLDYLLAGAISTGTSPTTAREIRVYVYAMLDDSNYPDVFDGTDSAETVTNAGIRDSCLKLAAVISTVATSDLAYPFGPVSVRSLFGGTLPPKWGVFVTHNTAVNLRSSANAIYATGVYETVA